MRSRTELAFGDKLQLLTKQPTDNLQEIKKAVDSIQDDGTGQERVFAAVYSTAEWYRRLRIPDEGTREPERNVMIIVFTDEAGSDQEGLDKTVGMCRRYEMPVYVVGVPKDDASCAGIQLSFLSLQQPDGWVCAAARVDGSAVAADGIPRRRVRAWGRGPARAIPPCARP